MNEKIEFTLEDYELEIQETERLSNRGIFVFRNLKTQQLLYVRLADEKSREMGGFWEMVSSKEMRSLHIQETTIEESFNKSVESQNSEKESNFDYHVEESEKTPTDEEVDRAMAEQKRKMNENQKTLRILVENASQTKDKTAEEIKEENNDLKAKLSIIAEMELARRKKALGLSPDDPMTGEQIKAYERGLRESKSGDSAPAGNAPLNAQQLGQSAQVGYETIQEMVDSVRFKATFSSDPAEKQQNQAILDELLRKWAMGKKQGIQDKIPENMQMTPKEYAEKKRKARNAR